MTTKLFESVIFGPIQSRRLGFSLGINLLPVNSKLCNFNCVYCECGWTDLYSIEKVVFYKRDEIKLQLEKSLIDLKIKNVKLDSITFAGNGEPTMHPQFYKIIDDVIDLRNYYFPECKISVLSNSLMLGNDKIIDALKKIGNRILKLDAGTEKMFQLINQPLNKRTLNWVVSQLMKFNGDLIIQTIFLRGYHNGNYIDNTTDEEINEWLIQLKKIKPQKVMIYSIDRATPEKKLQEIELNELYKIANRVNLIGIETLVS